MANVATIPLDKPIIDRSTGLLTRVWAGFFQTLRETARDVVEAPVVLQGTHFTRLATTPAGTYPDGTLFYETDRGVTYISLSSRWRYADGVMRGSFDTAPIDLTGDDVGFLFESADFGHVLRWAGTDGLVAGLSGEYFRQPGFVTGWQFALGDGGNGYYATFAIAPSATGWQLCDGSAATYLKLGATLTTLSFTTPVVANQYFRR